MAAAAVAVAVAAATVGVAEEDIVFFVVMAKESEN